MADKTPNYTDAQASELEAAYVEAETESERESVVAEFAEKFGKNTRSIRAKLSNLGVYVKKEPTTKTGEPVERKSAIVESIARLLGCNSETVESLEKATKVALLKVRDALPKAEAE